MCGLAGMLVAGGMTHGDFDALEAMNAAIHHRGPDQSGTFADSPAGIGLAHRRLSILDLSDSGRQPMESASGRYVIAYNGEIYNFASLREELAGYPFHSGTDTEVLLAGIEAWGVRRTLGRAVGMFAFALWDRQERELVLARDRLGIKPLVYARVPGAVLFGSDLNAVRANPRFPREIDRGALAASLRFNCVPGPRSIFAAAQKVPPGTFLVFRDPHGAPREETYWSAADAAARGLADPLPDEEEVVLAEVLDTLRRVVGDRLVADVPLGAFLSGGIDSSTVVALMAELSSDVRTFSIGQPRGDYDEGAIASEVAAHLGTRHENLEVDGAAALAVVPHLATMYDEPFGDSSQIPTYLVSELARRSVTVTLSGDGGDELFGGYHRHFWGPQVWRALSPVPLALRRAVERGVHAVPVPTLDRIYQRLSPPLPSMRLPGQKVHKLAGLFGAESGDELYRLLTSHVRAPRDWVIGTTDEAQPGHAPAPAAAQLAERMMYGDLVRYLPDDILTKVDRASMAVSLEARVPLLDHRLVELSWRVPLRYRVHGLTGKWVLRKILGERVPARLWDRPKMGFGVPVGDWLRGPLRDWAEALLDPRRLRDEGIFEVDTIRARWADVQAERGEWHNHLWNVLSFQAWYEALSPARAGAARGEGRLEA